jgi:CRISPR-associated protein (Cas_Cas02710)
MNQRFLQGLVDPGKSLLFFLVFGTFGLTIASDALSDLVLNRFGEYLETHGKIHPVLFRSLLFFLVTGMIILAIALSDLSRWFTKRPADVKPRPLKKTFPGLLVIASIASPGVKSAAQVAIEHHWNDGKGNLAHCWMICAGEKPLEHARRILEQLPGTLETIDKNSREYRLTDLDNPRRQLRASLRDLNPLEIDNPHETFQLVNAIYNEAEKEGISPSDTIADYTGGTKSMTVGLVLACANPDRHLQFLKPAGYIEDGRADTSKPSIATEAQINFQLKSVRPNDS